MKLLLWIILIGLGVAVLRGKFRAAQARTEAAAPHPQIPAGEPMLRCAQCGVYFPVSEASYGHADSAYCCDEHRRVGEHR